MRPEDRGIKSARNDGVTERAVPAFSLSRRNNLLRGNSRVKEGDEVLFRHQGEKRKGDITRSVGFGSISIYTSVYRGSVPIRGKVRICCRGKRLER